MSYAATIGFFDGVHRGHRFLMAHLQLAAMSRGLQTALITFEQHPKGGKLLTPYDERIELLKSAHFNQIFCFQYPVIQDMKAREFLEVLRDRCEVKMLMMGYDHRFGRDLLDFKAVQKLGVKGIEIVQAPQLEEMPCSSSLIRNTLREGQIEQANTMLTYPYTLIGEVVHGKALGRTIGYPTANIQIPADKLIPKTGVYEIEGGILNIGTASDGTPIIEAHYLSDPGDIYGHTIAVSLKRRIRDERHFDTLEQLREQITEDIKTL